MKINNGRILVYAEDPGAANYLGPVIPELRAAGCFVALVAGGLAISQFEREGIEIDSNDEGGAAELIGRYYPSLVVVGTSENTDSLGLHLIDEAGHQGIISVSAVDGSANARYRFAGRSTHPLNHAPDWLLVPDSITRSMFVDLGMNSERVVDVGHPHFDHVRDIRTRLQKEGRNTLRTRLFPAAGNRKIVVFVAEISAGLGPQQYQRSEDYTLQGLGRSDNRTDIVLEEVLLAIAARPERPYFVLRLHPKNLRDDFSGFDGKVDCVSQMEDAREVAFVADLVVGMSSHMLIEAVLLGRPTLSVLPREEEREWLPAIASGLTRCATTREGVQSNVGELLGPTRPVTSEEVIAQSFNLGARKRAADLLVALTSDPRRVC